MATVISRVGRRYTFRAVHSLPTFPEPWCFPHEHDYTVEIEAEGGTPTDALDQRWSHQMVGFEGSQHLLNSMFEPSTVENISEGILAWFEDLSVVKVTVWEDQARYGVAIRPNPGISRAVEQAEAEEEPVARHAMAISDRPFIH